MIGTKVEHYEILERIASGGMGEVYRARDLELDRDVAIKCVRPEYSELEEVTQRFRSEARTLAALSHLNIATVYRFFENDGRLFLVMEYIDGCPFGRLLKNEGAMAPERAVTLVGEALHGLSYAHQHQVVHRDIKPGNLMLDQQNNVKVLDFGIAHLVGSTRFTRVGSIVGTPAYMAPEQILGKPIDPRTDIYSIGIVLYEMLSGKLPYSANSDFEVMRAHVESVPRSLADLANTNVPPRLQQSIERALQKDINQRFQTADEFADDLLVSFDSNRTVVLPAAAGHAAAAQPADPTLDTTQPFSISGLAQNLSGLVQSEWLTNKVTVARWPIAIAAAVLLLLLGTLFFESDKPENQLASAPAEFANDAGSDGGQNLQNANASATQAQPASSTEKETAAATTNNSERGQDGGGSSTPPAAATADGTRASKAASTTASEPRNTAQNEQPPASTSYRIRTVKFGAHEVQRTGRVSRSGAYNAAFALAVPFGADPIIEVEEFVRVFRNGVLVREQVIKTEPRSAGQFKTKSRIADLKTLEPGVYDMQLLLRHKGRTLGQAKWKLTVRD